MKEERKKQVDSDDGDEPDRSQKGSIKSGVGSNRGKETPNVSGMQAALTLGNPVFSEKLKDLHDARDRL